MPVPAAPLPPLGALLLACALPACSAPGTAPDGGGSDAATAAPRFAGEPIVRRLAGLWSGSATGTLLGDFPLMNMDLRAADARVLFGRTDLDATNNLRFALAIETLDGKDGLVFRSGGYFLGILRDTRATLLEHDDAAGTYRFCATSGCGYLDARYAFVSDTRMTLDVKVRGQAHLLWTAQRLEARELPAPFPADLASQGPGDAPFPAMPSLRVEVGWGAALTAPADVWVILSQSGCGVSACVVSRSLRAEAAAGATRAELLLSQIHGGGYKALAIVDRNRNLAGSLRPDHGDGVTLPDQPIAVAAQGESRASLRVALDLP